MHIMNEMKAFVEEGKDFFESYVITYFKEQFPDDTDSIERCRDWTMSNAKWRMFYVVFDLLNDKHFSMKIYESTTVLD